MAQPVKIDLNKGNVSWSIEVDNLKVVIYDGIVKDKNNKVFDHWGEQDTNDHQIDTFEIKKLAVPALEDGRLILTAIVIDPSDQGGNYVATVKFFQQGKQIGESRLFPGTVPAGYGADSRFADIFKFQ